MQVSKQAGVYNLCKGIRSATRECMQSRILSASTISESCSMAERYFGVRSQGL